MTTSKVPEQNLTREILIVDDDPGQRSLLTTFLSGQGYTPTTVSSGEEALRELKSSPFKMMISDVRMPGMTGLETLRQARTLHPNLPVLLVTAYADVKDAVGAMRDGAVNYLEKPIDLDELLHSVRQALGLKEKKSDAKPSLEIPQHLVTSSPLSLQAYRDAQLVAPSESRVLIVGERGVGKSTLAEWIHTSSPNGNHPFESLDCSATDPEQMDRLLFGSESTPSVLFPKQQTTLVLEQIGDLPPQSQLRLLRAIQDQPGSGASDAAGSTPLARIIATSTTDLTPFLSDGTFRDDLFFRLNLMEIVIPPLRERTADIMPLATAFIKEFTQGHARFAAPVTPCLENYEWPGNIQELRNAMERATLMAHGGLILPKHLPAKVQKAGTETESGEATQTRKMADVERETILQALKDNRNNRSVTARILGISRRALTYKLQKYREEGYLSDS